MAVDGKVHATDPGGQVVYSVDASGRQQPASADNPVPVAFVGTDTINLTGTVALDTFGALNDGAELNPAAASATIPALLRGLLTVLEGSGYETVAASQTAQVLGATGAAGDTISGLLIIPASTSPGNVLLFDGATSITIFAGGASSVADLKPFFVPLNIVSSGGAWKVTTGAAVSVIGIGRFT